MKMKLAALAAMVLAALALAGCDNDNDRKLQGWVEAELIFVSPDEQGRVEALKVREGDHVKQGDLLFTVDDDLQKADVVVQEGRRHQRRSRAFDRAKRTAEDRGRHAEDLRRRRGRVRQAKANLAWSQTRLARRDAYSPADGTIEQVYFRVGETVPAGKPVVALLPPRQSQDALLRAGAAAAGDQIRRDRRGLLRRLRQGADRQSELHRPQRRIHAAGDLQPR